MKHRDYLFITFLLVLFSFTLSEARIMDPGAGETIGQPPSWSVIIPVKDTTSVSQQMAAEDIARTSLHYRKTECSFRKMIQINRTKQGNTQHGKQNSIFDRWGNMKNKRSK